ncbi:MAG: hypothetical protein ACE5KE_09105 [Methanosarcinales archaeon]
MLSKAKETLQRLINDNKRIFVAEMPKFRLNINKHNSLEHELKKAEILTKSLHNGFDAWTEVPLKTKSIADVLILDTKTPIIYEVMKSENKDKYKKKKFDKRIKVIKVKI